MSAPAPVSACVGGMEFAWAVAHTRGWIATATVEASDPVPVGYHRLTLRDVEAVSGRTPALHRTTVAMGAVCDQTPHVGDLLLVLDDIAIEPPYDTPVAYVIRGADANAIPAADLARVLRSLPATDTAPVVVPASSSGPAVMLGLLGVGLAGAWLAMRRFRERPARQVGSMRSRPHR